MSLLSDYEKTEAVADVARLITSSGQTVMVQRIAPGERLFSSDDELFNDLVEIPAEINETPAEDLADTIDATCSVLPDTDVQREDRLVIGGKIYRIQTIEPEYFFGTVTHKSLELVKIHGR